MDLALAIATLLNTAAPGVAQVVMMIKETNGTITIMPLLDEANTNFNADITKGHAWLAARGK